MYGMLKKEKKELMYDVYMSVGIYSLGNGNANDLLFILSKGYTVFILDSLKSIGSDCLGV